MSDMATYRPTIDPSITRLIVAVKERRNARHPQHPETRSRLDSFENQFDDHDVLWYWLDLILHNPKDADDSIIDRLGIPFWESQDEEIIALWARITDPTQIPHLEERALRPGINPHARKMTQKALAIAKERTQR